MQLEPAAPIAFMVVGAALAVFGYACRPRGAAARTAPPRAVLRLIWDLFAGAVTVLICAAFAFGPRTKGPAVRKSGRNAR